MDMMKSGEFPSDTTYVCRVFTDTMGRERFAKLIKDDKYVDIDDTKVEVNEPFPKDIATILNLPYILNGIRFDHLCVDLKTGLICNIFDLEESHPIRCLFK